MCVNSLRRTQTPVVDKSSEPTIVNGTHGRFLDVAHKINSFQRVFSRYAAEDDLLPVVLQRLDAIPRDAIPRRPTLPRWKRSTSALDGGVGARMLFVLDNVMAVVTVKGL